MRRSCLSLIAGAVLSGAVVLGGCGVADMGAENADGGPTSCGVLLTVSDETPAPGDTIVAEAQPEGGGGPFQYSWRVTDAEGADVPVTPRTTDGTQVDIPIAQPGSYLVYVEQITAWGFTCHAQRSVLAKNPSGTSDVVLLRLTPPAASGIPVQQRRLSITGGTPQADLMITLDRGIPLEVTLEDALGASADAFVRLMANDVGFEAEAYVRAGEPLKLVLLDDSYDLLVIPDESGAAPRFAPRLAVDQPFASLIAAGTIPLEPGVVVAGTATGPDGAPLAGARVVLGRGRLPSTVGTVDASGAFAVRVEQGEDFGLSVAAPEGSGLPDLEVPAGISVPAQPGDIAVAYDDLARSDLDVEIRSHATGDPVAGARVTLLARLARAGSVTVDGVTLPAPGVLRRVAVTDGDGRLALAGLPDGAYDLVIEPLGQTSADEATTRVPLSLPAGPQTVTLFGKVTLSGTLGRPAGVVQGDLAGTRVIAIRRSTGSGAPALGSAPMTAADGAGSFGVRVDPDPAAPAQYLVLAEPPEASGLARGMALVDVGGEDVALGTLRLPRGLRLAGTVAPTSGTPLAGVYIEAFRSRPPGQEDPAVRAEAVTDADGHFSLLFCDPDDLQ